MTITINFLQTFNGRIPPRKPVTLYNVDAVVDKGIRMVEVRMTFSDHRPTYDHVASVTIVPDKE